MTLLIQIVTAHIDACILLMLILLDLNIYADAFADAHTYGHTCDVAVFYRTPSPINGIN